MLLKAVILAKNNLKGRSCIHHMHGHACTHAQSMYVATCVLVLYVVILHITGSCN